MSGSLEPCRKKLRRAEHHREILDDEIGEFYRNNRYRVVRDPDSNEFRHVFRIYGLVPPRDYWPLIAGDCLYNLRATLDYLVYQLALNIQDPLPAEWAGLCMFPIYGNEALFRERGQRRIAMLGEGERTLITDLQPFNAGDYPTLEGLALHRPRLRWLEAAHITDKHRDLNVVWQGVKTGSHFADPDCRWDFKMGPLEEGAVIAEVTCRTAHPEMDVNRDSIRLGVSVDQPGVQGGDLHSVLRDVSETVEKILGLFEPFFP